MTFFLFTTWIWDMFFSLQTDGLGGAEMQQDLETLKQAPKQWGKLTAVCGYDIYEILADFWRKPRLATFIWRNVKRMLLCC